MTEEEREVETIEKKKDLSDDEVITVIKREVKKRNSSIEEYKKYGKEEVVESLQKEIDILSVYLPEELSDEQIIKVVDETIAELNAASIKEMGTVIKTVSSKIGNQADMSKVSSIVKEKLS